MSTGPQLPKELQTALHLEVKRLLVNRIFDSQEELADKVGCSQGMISKLSRRVEVGVDVADKFCKAFGVTREELMTRHKTRGPASEVDMLVVELLAWIEGSPVIREVSRRPDVTVKDLLRLKKTPPRHGETKAEEVYAHLMQLRVGEIGVVPAITVRAAPLEAQMRLEHGRTMPKKKP